LDILEIIRKIKEYWYNLEKIDKYLILFLLFSFLIRIIFFTYSPIKGWDETVYLNLGSDLSNNPLLYSLENSGWSDFISTPEPVYEWPNIGFRAPILPYILSFFYFLKLDYLIPFLMPFIVSMSILLVYILGQNMFNKKVGFYGAVFFSLIPINIFTSDKIWTDPLIVFFLLLTFISFWKGYENNNNKHKILFGLFLALSLLSRYTTLWIIPIFLIYFLIRDKSFKFLFDTYIWKAILVFMVTLLPWFIYGFVFYQNPLGGFVHGFKASAYWGGIQPWTYFIDNSWFIFSIIGWLFLASLFYIFYKKDYIKKEIYLLLIWFIFFYLIVTAMPHKEERFITPIIPAICLLSAFFVDKQKNHKKVILIIVCILLINSFYGLYKLGIKESRNTVNRCFYAGNIFMAREIPVDNSLIITNKDPIVHYYTKRDTIVYPISWNLKLFRNLIETKYKDKLVYLYFSNYDMDMPGLIKDDLDKNFEKIYECSIEIGYSAVYKYK